MIGFAIVIWYFLLGGLESSVADDLTEEYEIAKRSGDAMQMCVHAGIVAAAYLQAQDDANYRYWQNVESSDCAAAGLPR